MFRSFFHSACAILITLALILLASSATSIAAPVLQNEDAGGEDYIVRAGDTLYKIAAAFYGDGSLWPQIRAATIAKSEEDSSYATLENPNLIRVGQKLWIPALDEGAQAPASRTDNEAETEDEGEDEDTEDVGVRFVSPVDGATVSTPFSVTMEATGLIVEPAGEIHEGAGHMHILVDTDFVEPGEVLPFDEFHLHFGQGQLVTTLDLEPGVHVLRLQFANGAHIALEGEQYQDTITVTVEADGTEPIVEDEDVEPGVRFVSPVDGATVSTPFSVTMEATGLIVEPAGEIRDNAGHMHILVDTDFVEPGEVLPFDEFHLHFGQGQLVTTLELEPGVHVLRLQFANGAHIALEGEQYQDTITVTVEADDEAAIEEEADEEAEEPGVRFVSPVDGATVSSPFSVTMEATGLTVEPAGEIREGAGHMHILVDTDFVEPGEVLPFDESHLHFGQGQLQTTLDLEPGVHVLRLQFANGAHIALEGEQYQDEIEITVTE